MTSEKAQFWQTVVLTTRADGQSPVPPMVVQQVAVMTAAHAMGLPSGWGVHNTDSGYMDQEGWLKYAKHFVDATSHGEAPTARRHLFLFIDGHDSHQSPEALQQLLDHNVHVLFLRSNASIGDQPNDNGPNAVFHAARSGARERWRASVGPAVPYNVTFANQVLAEAHAEYLGKSSPVIVKAFKKTGIWPLVRAPANYGPAAAALAAPFLTPPPNPAPAADENTPPQPPPPTECTLEWYKAQLQATQAENARLQAQVAAGHTVLMFAPPPAPPAGSAAAAPLQDIRNQQRVVVRTAVASFLQKSTLRPAQEIAAELALHRAAKKQRVHSGLDTSGGLIMSQDIIEDLRQRQKVREAEEAKVVAEAAKRKETREERQVQQRAAADAALAKLRLSATDAALKGSIAQLTVDTLRACLLRLKAPVKDPVTKKELLQQPLRNALRGILLPQLSGAAGTETPQALVAGA